MRLYYVGESESPDCYVLSALGVDAERWNDMFADMQDWRSELRGRYGIPPDSDLSARDPGTRTGQALLVEGGTPAINGSANERLTRRKGAAVLTSGLGRIENAAATKGGVEVINVCLPKQAFKDHERVSLDRMLNRVNASVKAANRHAFLIFDEGKEAMITRVYRRLRVFNPVPSRYELWEEGERTRNILLENVIGGPSFRSTEGDYLLQMAGLIAHALLMQEEEPFSGVGGMGVLGAFSILDCALNRKASRRDPQGIVRR